jgi:hypothetical protein
MRHQVTDLSSSNAGRTKNGEFERGEVEDVLPDVADGGSKQ